MKIQHLIISSCIALSATAFAEPPKDEQTDSAQKKSEKIEISVEKIERADKKLKGPQDTDLDGDGYGDVATKAAGDPIPGIDITENQSPPGKNASAAGVKNATAGQNQASESRAKGKVKAKEKVKCKVDDDCDDY